MFCKQGESIDGTKLICSACDQVSMLYAGKPLCPAAVNMDCSDAFRAGVLMVHGLASLTCVLHYDLSWCATL